MITCAITGSSGVLGQKIKKYLPYKFYEFKKDITNIKNVEKWINKKNFDIIIHCAAVVPTNMVNNSYKKAYDVNVNGTLNLVNSILNKKKKPKWFFFSSTSHVYKLNTKFVKINKKNKPKPQSKYGKTKLLAEDILIKKLKNSSINLCIGRIFSFTDKRQKVPFVIPTITEKIKSSKKIITLKNLNHFRDFLNTKDIAKVINVMRERKCSGIYNIGSGIKFSLKNIAQLISEKYNKKIKFLDSNKTTYLISDNKKILRLNWKSANFKKNLNYFYK